MHALLRAIGVISLIRGLGFIRRTGRPLFSYPNDQFVTSRDAQWVYYGAGIAVVGILLIIFSRPSDDLGFDNVHGPIAASTALVIPMTKLRTGSHLNRERQEDPYVQTVCV